MPSVTITSRSLPPVQLPGGSADAASARAAATRALTARDAAELAADATAADAIQTAADRVQTGLDAAAAAANVAPALAHAARTDNPHGTTDAQVPYTPPGAGAVTRTVRDKLRELGVVDADYTTETDRAAAAMARTVTERAFLRRFQGPDGRDQLRVSAFPSATEYVEIMGGPAHTGPTISFWSDTDANCDGNLVAKGTGGIFFGNASGVLGAFRDNGLTSIPDAYVSIENSAPGQPPRIRPVPVNGGERALHISGTQNHGVLIGTQGQATAFANLSLGNFCNVFGAFSIAGGNGATDRGANAKLAYGAGFISGESGLRQLGLQVFGARVTGTAPTTLTSSESNTLGAFNGIVLGNRNFFHAQIAILYEDTVTLDVAMWTGRALWRRGANAASTTLVWSTLTQDFASPSLAAATVALSANTTFGCGVITGTGVGANPCRWGAKVFTLEIGHP